MTDPNPLKQAAEEAKARKLAEVAVAKKAVEQAGDPLEGRELRGLMIVRGPIDPPSLVGGQTLKDVVFWATQKGIVIPRNDCDRSVREFDRVLQAENKETIDARASWPYLIIIPEEAKNVLDLQRMLDDNGLVPATIRELISFDWRRRDTPLLNSLLALGSIVPGGTSDLIASLEPAQAFGNNLRELPINPWVTLGKRDGILVRVKPMPSASTP
jgi:hypothetical protein